MDDIRDFVIARLGTWFDVVDQTDTQLSLETRDHGSVGDEQYGERDWREAQRIGREVAKEFPDAKAHLDASDEWVYVDIVRSRPADPEPEEDPRRPEGFEARKVGKKWVVWHLDSDRKVFDAINEVDAINVAETSDELHQESPTSYFEMFGYDEDDNILIHGFRDAASYLSFPEALAVARELEAQYHTEGNEVDRVEISPQNYHSQGREPFATFDFSQNESTISDETHDSFLSGVEF